MREKVTRSRMLRKITMNAPGSHDHMDFLSGMGVGFFRYTASPCCFSDIHRDSRYRTKYRPK